MPVCTDNEPNSMFTEDLFQSNSFIDLLHSSPDLNMSCYMSDDEPLALPPMLPTTSHLSSPIGGSVSVLDMINHDVMFGPIFQGAKSSANTEVTYVRTAPSTAPSTSAGDVLLSPAQPTTVANTFVNPLQSNDAPSFASRGGKTMIKINSPDSPSMKRLQTPKSTNTNTTISKNPFEVNPFVQNEKQTTAKPLTATTGAEPEKDKSSNGTSPSSSKKLKNSVCSSHSTSSRSGSKKISRSSCKRKNTFVINLTPRDALQPPATRSSFARSLLTHSITRKTDVVTEASVALAPGVETYTTATLAQPVGICSVTATTTTTATTTSMASRSVTAVGTTDTTNLCTTTSMCTSYTVTKPRAPVSIIPSLRNTYLPTNVLYSAPSIITRPLTPVVSSTAQYAIPAKGSNSSTDSGVTRPRTRLVIPLSLSTAATTAASTVTTTASATCKHRVVHAVRPIQCPPAGTVAQMHVNTTTSTAVCGRALARTSIALPPGATVYTARKVASDSHAQSTSTTQPQTITIVDSKGKCTTLTISPDFTTTTASSINLTSTVTAGEDSRSTVTSSAVVRPRSQLVVPIANTQMSPSLGYLVTSPVASAATAAQRPTTTIASHTITTISSEVINRIRSRLLCNVPRAVSGLGQLPPSTTTGVGSKARSPVTIIANQLISAAASSAVTAPDPSTRPLNRVVIPIMSNADSSSHSSPSTQGAYIITGVNQPTTSTPRDAVSRPPRVIPIVHRNKCGTSVVATSATAATSGSRPCPAVAVAGTTSCSPPIGAIDPHAKLRGRLTIQVGTPDKSVPRTTSPRSTFTITRSRALRSGRMLPGVSTRFISATKTSDAPKNPATMTLITFSPPGASGASVAGAPLRSSSSTHCNAPSPFTTTTTVTMTTATPTLSTTGNRFVIKLATSTSAASSASASSATASVTSLTKTTTISPDHRFTEPQPISSRLRTFPTPRTYSIAQRTSTTSSFADPQRATAGAPSQQSVSCVKKLVTTSPLQIFADVVTPRTTQSVTTTASMPSISKSRFTLTQGTGCSTLVLPQYKSTVYKNVPTISHHGDEQLRLRLSERLVNRSVAFVSPQRSTGVGGAPSAGTAPSTSPVAPSVTPRVSRSTVPHTLTAPRPQPARTPSHTTAAQYPPPEQSTLSTNDLRRPNN